MKNVIIISGLAGSGKTYLAEQVKEKLNYLMDVRWVGTTPKDYETIIDNSKGDELLLLEMHPPFPDEWRKDINLLHIALSKDYSLYKNEISKDKIEFLQDWFKQNERKDWVSDIIEYNRRRFEHIGHIKGDYLIAEDIESALDMIEGFIEETKKKELFKFANENYEYMLYHSVNFAGVGYEGTAPSDLKFEDLKLSSLEIDKKGSCLDVGCNVGYISYLINEFCINKINAIDIEKENIKCAKFLQNKFFNKNKIIFEQMDFMKVKEPFDYVFALAVLHHVAKKHDTNEVFSQLGNITKKAAVIEINEMPGWNKTQIVNGLKMHFRQVNIIGNSRMPVGKEKHPNRWIIHCIKGE